MQLRPIYFPFLVAIAGLMLGGCPKKDDASIGMVKVCTQVGQRCLHSPGKMGICGESSEVTDCAAPPCLKCTSQH